MKIIDKNNLDLHVGEIEVITDLKFKSEFGKNVLYCKKAIIDNTTGEGGTFTRIIKASDEWEKVRVEY